MSLWKLLIIYLNVVNDLEINYWIYYLRLYEIPSEILNIKYEKNDLNWVKELDLTY